MNSSDFMLGTSTWTTQRINDAIQSYNILEYGNTILNRITFISIFIMFLFFLRIILIKSVFPHWKTSKDFNDVLEGCIEISIVSAGMVQIALCLIYFWNYAIDTSILQCIKLFKSDANLFLHKEGVLPPLSPFWVEMRCF